MTGDRPAPRNRPRRGLTFACVLALLVAAGLALGTLTTRRPMAAAADSAFDTRLRELGMVPLGGRLPRAFSLPALDGGRFTLGQLTGRAALLYFWATW